MPEDFSAVEVKEFAVAFGGFEARGGVGGTLGEKPKLAGKIETNEFDPRALLTSVGIEAPKTTDPRRSASCSSRAAGRSTTAPFGVDPFALSFDDTHFTGTFAGAAR